MYLPRHNVAALLHEATYRHPDGIVQREAVLQFVGIFITRMGRDPFVRREPTEEEDGQGGGQVAREYPNPQTRRKGIHEGKETGLFRDRLLVHDGQAEGEEGAKKKDMQIVLNDK